MKPWTDKDLKTLRVMYQTARVEDIAAHFGRTVHAIRIRARKDGMIRPPYSRAIPVTATKKRKAEIYREGWHADAPIHYPVDAKGRPLYKITVAPKPPERLYRTATFAQFG